MKEELSRDSEEDENEPVRKKRRREETSTSDFPDFSLSNKLTINNRNIPSEMIPSFPLDEKKDNPNVISWFPKIPSSFNDYSTQPSTSSHISSTPQEKLSSFSRITEISDTSYKCNLCSSLQQHQRKCRGVQHCFQGTIIIQNSFQMMELKDEITQAFSLLSTQTISFQPYQHELQEEQEELETTSQILLQQQKQKKRIRSEFESSPFLQEPLSPASKRSRYEQMITQKIF